LKTNSLGYFSSCSLFNLATVYPGMVANERFWQPYFLCEP
jgi:hypothetical protein